MGQLENLKAGIPVALGERKRIEDIYRLAGKTGSLGFSLVNHANLLTQLGRGLTPPPNWTNSNGRNHTGADAYVGRRPLRQVRARTSTHHHGPFEAVAAPAEQAQVEARTKGTSASHLAVSAALMARILAEHAAARLGRSRLPRRPSRRGRTKRHRQGRGLRWPIGSAQTLLLRKDPERAAAVALAALSRPWRGREARIALAAGLGSGPALAAKDTPRSATIRASAKAALDELRTTWDATFLTTYLARANLVGMSDR